MDNQFIYCPNCSTRNFADDKVCGVCKTKLSSKTINQGTKRVPVKQPNRNPKIIQHAINTLASPQNPKLSTPKLSGCAWIIIISLAIVGYTTFFGDDSKKSSSSKEAVINSEWDGSVQPVEDYIKNNLNDPDSYKSVSWSEVFKLNDTKEIGFASYQVRHKYRAKNAFGAYVTEEKLFKLDYQGNIVEVRDWIR